MSEIIDRRPEVVKILCDAKNEENGPLFTDREISAILILCKDDIEKSPFRLSAIIRNKEEIGRFCNAEDKVEEVKEAMENPSQEVLEAERDELNKQKEGAVGINPTNSAEKKENKPAEKQEGYLRDLEIKEEALKAIILQKYVETKQKEDKSFYLADFDYKDYAEYKKNHAEHLKDDKDYQRIVGEINKLKNGKSGVTIEENKPAEKQEIEVVIPEAATPKKEATEVETVGEEAVPVAVGEDPVAVAEFDKVEPEGRPSIDIEGSALGVPFKIEEVHPVELVDQDSYPEVPAEVQPVELVDQDSYSEVPAEVQPVELVDQDSYPEDQIVDPEDQIVDPVVSAEVYEETLEGPLEPEVDIKPEVKKTPFKEKFLGFFKRIFGKKTEEVPAEPIIIEEEVPTEPIITEEGGNGGTSSEKSEEMNKLLREEYEIVYGKQGDTLELTKYKGWTFRDYFDENNADKGSGVTVAYFEERRKSFEEALADIIGNRDSYGTEEEYNNARNEKIISIRNQIDHGRCTLRYFEEQLRQEKTNIPNNNDRALEPVLMDHEHTY